MRNIQMTPTRWCALLLVVLGGAIVTFSTYKALAGSKELAVPGQAEIKPCGCETPKEE